MSSRLWGAYFENDLDKFRGLLGLSEERPGESHDFASGSVTNDPPFDFNSPPRRQSTFTASGGDSKSVVLNRFQINSRLPANTTANPFAPNTGLTILHHAATQNKLEFVEALLKHPQVDLFLQDFESGWTALHRSLYFGNISVAKQILGKDDSGIGLLKIKDREGNAPFELFDSTIKVENSKATSGLETSRKLEDEEDDGENEEESFDLEVGEISGEYLGDEAFVWGSNKNLSLGFSDGDDRQFPERIAIPNPNATHEPQDAILTLEPVYIKDIQMAKFHTAIITTASSNNLYMCGHGPGGRLGLGHESTEFTFKRVSLPRQVRTVALGQDHTVAVLDNGDVFTWGTGRYGQLGYAPNMSKNDKEEYQLVPRQVFTNLRKEKVVGAAASKHHSVVHTTDSIFVFGKNEGQLALVDSDSRTLETQISPRKVATTMFDQPVIMVTATDKSTAVLLENHDVWMFMNYGIMKITFPFERFPNTGIKPTRPTSRHQSRPNFITKISSGGGTIAALSRMGDVFTVNVDKTGATNTRSLPLAQRIWSLKKRQMAVRDVDVGQEGAVIICTESGSVWQRTRRSKVKENSNSINTITNTQSSNLQLDRAKDYKFARIPSLTHTIAVRSNAFGSFAAIRRDVDILKTQLKIRNPTLWDDIGSLISFYDEPLDESEESEAPEPESTRKRVSYVRDNGLKWFLQNDLEGALKDTIHEMDLTEYDTVIRSPEFDELRISIPAHSFILAGRCPRLRSLFAKAITSRTVRHDILVELHHQPGGTFELIFHGISWYSLLLFIFYLYKDVVIPVWTNYSKDKEQTQQFQKARADLGALAKYFGLTQLATVVSGLATYQQTLNSDMGQALLDPHFEATGDMLLELKDKTAKVHSSLLCARCSFFDALYHGGSGRWLASRRGEENFATDQLVRVDMKHVTSETMEIVLRFLYTDRSIHLFDKVQVAKDGLDAFIDLVIDVLGVANELMLDRLVEVCQKVIGRFVNTRNACSILAAISESSVVEFKDVCLEYIFRNLETVMETRALDEFDDYLLAELDETVKARQLAYMPITRSGRAEIDLQERHPHLAGARDIEHASVLQLLDTSQTNPLNADVDQTGSPTSFRQSSTFRTGSYEKNKRRRSSKSGQEKPSVRSPPLLPTQGSEFIFDMDDEDVAAKLSRTPVSHSPGVSRSDTYGFGVSPKVDVWYDSKGKQIAAPEVSTNTKNTLQPKTQPLSETSNTPVQEGSARQPWVAGQGIHSAKLDMRDIMAQASKNRTSNLSLGLTAISPTEQISVQDLPSTGFNAPITAKVSQKERKRQQQQQQLQANQNPTPAAVPSTPEKGPSAPKASPWKSIRSPSNPISLSQVSTGSPSTPVKDAGSKLLDRFNTPPQIHQSPSHSIGSPKQTTPSRAVSSPIAKPNIQTSAPQVQTRRYNSSGDVIGSPTRSGPSKSGPAANQPRSERYDDFPPILGRVEHVGLPLAEIIQQEKIQQDIIKGKAPKQSIQDIQQEQEFLSWWEKESERMQQEELERNLLEQGKKVALGRGRGRGGGAGARARGRGNARGRGGKHADVGASGTVAESQPSTAPKRDNNEGSGARGKPRGRGKIKKVVRSGGPTTEN